MKRDESTAEDDSASGRARDEHAARVVEYHEASETFRTQFDSSTRRASEAVLSAVATATGRDPLDLPPLYSVLDPDALDSLFTRRLHGRHRQDATVRFEYVGCRVSVRAHGTVLVEPPEEAGSA